MLSTRLEIYKTAVSLARYLEKNYKDIRDEAPVGETPVTEAWLTGSSWTDHIFATLRGFAEQEFGLKPTDCFHRRHPDGNGEFLWDFIAARPEFGILLAAESEQDTHRLPAEDSMKHDFEKLLYVFAPLRLLICKSKNSAHSGAMLKKLTDYAQGCCHAFNPGSAFLVHFHHYGNQGGQTFLWQSAGEPAKLKGERLLFDHV